jgi:hypothetical protein
MCHCERSEAISRDCHVASLLALTTFQEGKYQIDNPLSPPFSKGGLGGILATLIQENAEGIK